VSWTQNDTAPTGTFTLSSTNPATGVTTTANLTGATVTMHVTRPDGTVITRTAGSAGLAVSSATAPATIAYDPQTGDLTLEGVYKFEHEVLYANGKRQTFGDVREYVDGELA
jgi:hypothetical protein